jgi:dephospho-CoA kinase
MLAKIIVERKTVASNMKSDSDSNEWPPFNCHLFHSFSPKEAWKAAGYTLQRENRKTGIIGVVGGSGSGKTSVNDILNQYHSVRIIEWDKIRHQCLKEQEVIRKFVAEFGNHVLDDEGKLDKQVLRELRLVGSENVMRLGKILHPCMFTRVYNKIVGFKDESTESIIAIEGFNLDKHGIVDAILDQLWYVNADEEVRISRLSKRKNQTKEEAKRHIDSQQEMLERLKNIRCVLIDNNDDFEKLKEQVASKFTAYSDSRSEQ